MELEVLLKGMGFAFFLAGQQGYYALSDVIMDIYLAHAAAISLLVIDWNWCWLTRKSDENNAVKNLKN